MTSFLLVFHYFGDKCASVQGIKKLYLIMAEGKNTTRNSI
jgi:hypothetical protein